MRSLLTLFCILTRTTDGKTPKNMGALTFLSFYLMSFRYYRLAISVGRQSNLEEVCRTWQRRRYLGAYTSGTGHLGFPVVWNDLGLLVPSFFFNCLSRASKLHSIQVSYPAEAFIFESAEIRNVDHSAQHCH